MAQRNDIPIEVIALIEALITWHEHDLHAGKEHCAMLRARYADALVEARDKLRRSGKQYS